MTFSAFALVVEPDRQAAPELAGRLFSEGIECTVAESGDHAWQALASRRPDLVLVALGTPALELFHRRLRDEYFGPRPHLVGMAEADALGPEVADLQLDAVLLRPLPAAGILAALAGAGRLPTAALDEGRLREMLKLSSLGNELQTSLDTIAHRLALVYGVSRCAIVASASERQWLGAVGESTEPEAWPDLWARCAQAVHAGAPLFAARARSARAGASALPVETRLAVPMPSPGGGLVGALCLFHDGPIRFAEGARDALVDLAARLGMELSWRSVHDRLAAERDHLRETALLDPTVGVLSRGALEQAIAAEIARHEASGDSMALAVIDITGLRQINDRYGHRAGDAAIKHLADVARRTVRPHDTVGRSGDDEIAVLFASTNVPAATALLDKIRRAAEAEPFEAGDSGPIYLRVGIGVTEHAPTDVDVSQLLDRAARTASAAGARGGAIALADRASPRAETKPNLLLDRYDAGVTLGGMYQIVHEISRGAMGVVYRAEDLGLSRPVALKMLRPDLVRDLELVRRFREEAAILAAINNENLVRVYSFVEDRDDVFFVMELVEGVSLDNHIAELSDEGRFIEGPRAAAIITQVAQALDAMHHAGVMHRDVKPGNVVLDRTRDRAVLVDVGLARRLGDRSEPAGTPGYIAPESFRGDPESPATDVYGLAATAYAILTARAPFGRADDYREILRRQLEEEPTPPTAWRTDLSQGVDAVILRGLSLHRAERFATAGELAMALEAALGAEPGDRTRARTKASIGTESAAPSPRRGAEPLAPAPGSVRVGESKRTLTLELGSGPRREPEPMTRGVVFRGVTRVLGLRAATAWVSTVERHNQALADALSLRTSPLSWVPARLFHELFVAVTASGRSAQAFARELGGHVVEQSFRRFYPSSPESLSPRSTLSALDILWRRYHTWGALRVGRVDERSAVVGYEGPQELALCGFIEGWLEQVVALSGGAEARAIHTRCAGQGAPACEFTATWS